MTDKPQRPESFEFALDSLVDPEASELRAYIEQLEARAALAEPVGEPSDENCWQWYTYCPEEGLEMYSDRKQAQSAAQSIMGSYEVAAHSDGWHEDMESVSWGMLVPVEQAQVVECKAAEPDDEFDEWVKYELRTARWGRQRDALGDCLTAGPDQSFTTEATNDNPHSYHTQAD